MFTWGIYYIWSHNVLYTAWCVCVSVCLSFCLSDMCIFMFLYTKNISITHAELSITLLCTVLVMVVELI